jgi:glycosyltransferase involved in cell wall biosynthesis
MTSPYDLSIVVPAYDEEASVQPFVAAVRSATAGLGLRIEVIFIDDGSRDETAAVIGQMKAADPDIALIRFARNFGKEAAVCAGLDVAQGAAVVVMDVDLQDPPSLIPEFVARWRAGADIVYGARRDRSSDSFPKRVAAKSFYRVFNRMAHRPIPPDAGDFRLMDRRVVDTLQLLVERSRFMKGLFAWPGFEVESVPFDRPARAEGDSRWSVRGLWTYGLTGVFNFSSAPLRLWSYAGALLMVAGLAFALVVLLQALVGDIGIPGYASTVILLVVLSGLQITGIGILGEYLSRTLEETKGRPLYVVTESDRMPDDRLLNRAVNRPELATFAFVREPHSMDGREPTDGPT